jgi:hypothetical protein
MFCNSLARWTKSACHGYPYDQISREEPHCGGKTHLIRSAIQTGGQFGIQSMNQSFMHHVQQRSTSADQGRLYARLRICSGWRGKASGKLTDLLKNLNGLHQLSKPMSHLMSGFCNSLMRASCQSISYSTISIN